MAWPTGRRSVFWLWRGSATCATKIRSLSVAFLSCTLWTSGMWRGRPAFRGTGYKPKACGAEVVRCQSSNLTYMGAFENPQSWRHWYKSLLGKSGGERLIYNQGLSSYRVTAKLGLSVASCCMVDARGLWGVGGWKSPRKQIHATFEKQHPEFPPAAEIALLSVGRPYFYAERRFPLVGSPFP